MALVLAGVGCDRPSAPAIKSAEPEVATAGLTHCGLGSEVQLSAGKLASWVPARLAASEPFAFWSTWQPGSPDGGDVPARVRSWTERSVDAWGGVPTPLGLFVWRVAGGQETTRTDGTPAVFLCLSFDPLQLNDGLLPLLVADQRLLRSAVEQSLLTSRQRETLERVRNGYLERWKGFQAAWAKFSASPRDDMTRDRFFDALVALPGDVHTLVQYDTFLERDQRVALRRLGHVIEGDAYSGEAGGVRSVIVRNYPVGLFVQRWNTMPAFLGLPEDRPRLRAIDGGEHLEFDLRLELRLGDQPEAQVVAALAALKDIPALRVEPGVR